MLNKVAFSVEGAALAHTACQLSASAEEAVREATFTVPPAGPGLPCLPGNRATITVDGELWGTGYVRDVRGSHDEGGRAYSVCFVSRTCDATECSIDHPTGLVRDADLMTVARTFDMLSIGIEGEVATERKDRHKIVPGETLFRTIETDARAQGVLIHDTPQGRLKLADRPEGRHEGALRYGGNIVRASGLITEAGRFSAVKVRGQASIGVSPTSLRPEATVTDGGVRRNRPRILPQEGEASSARLMKRAQWEAKRGAGNGTSASVTIAGWRDDAGRLWTRNWLVEVDDPAIGIMQDMVIANVQLDQDSTGGTTAMLSLKDPRALGGGNPRGSSAASWAAPGSAEPAYREESEI